MRKIWIILIIMFWVFTGFISAAEYRNEPDGFRGIKWSADISKINGLKLEEKSEDREWYSRPGDNMQMGEAKSASISYYFYRGKFARVKIKLKGAANYSALKKYLFDTYGARNEVGGITMWPGKKTIIMLSKSPDLEETILTMDSKAMLKWEEDYERWKAKQL